MLLHMYEAQTVTQIHSSSVCSCQLSKRRDRVAECQYGPPKQTMRNAEMPAQQRFVQCNCAIQQKQAHDHNTGCAVHAAHHSILTIATRQLMF